MSDASIVNELRNWQQVWTLVGQWAARRDHYDEKSERLLAQQRADYAQELATKFGNFIEGYVAPRLGQAQQELMPPGSINYWAVATTLRRLEKPTQAALVEYMARRDNASCADVAREVHRDEDANSQAIRMNARRTNEELFKLNVPIRFQVKAGVVFKESTQE